MLTMGMVWQMEQVWGYQDLVEPTVPKTLLVEPTGPTPRQGNPSRLHETPPSKLGLHPLSLTSGLISGSFGTPHTGVDQNPSPGSCKKLKTLLAKILCPDGGTSPKSSSDDMGLGRPHSRGLLEDMTPEFVFYPDYPDCAAQRHMSLEFAHAAFANYTAQLAPNTTPYERAKKLLEIPLVLPQATP